MMTIKSEKNKIQEFAYAASATSSLLDQQENNTINLQLTSWKNAKKIYFKIKGENAPKLEEMISVVNHLGNSLTYLFGANYMEEGHTPSLKKMIDEICPKKGLDLKSDNPDLYKRFCELDEVHKSVSKHFSRGKIPEAKKITKQILNEYMETTRKIWIWFLDKKFEGNIPPEQLTEFGNI
jgi:hypothetical protein